MLWAVLCFIFPLIGLIVILLLPPKTAAAYVLRSRQQLVDGGVVVGSTGLPPISSSRAGVVAHDDVVIAPSRDLGRGWRRVGAERRWRRRSSCRLRVPSKRAGRADDGDVVEDPSRSVATSAPRNRSGGWSMTFWA